MGITQGLLGWRETNHEEDLIKQYTARSWIKVKVGCEFQRRQTCFSRY